MICCLDTLSCPWEHLACHLSASGAPAKVRAPRFGDFAQCEYIVNENARGHLGRTYRDYRLRTVRAVPSVGCPTELAPRALTRDPGPEARGGTRFSDAPLHLGVCLVGTQHTRESVSHGPIRPDRAESEKHQQIQNIACTQSKAARKRTDRALGLGGLSELFPKLETREPSSGVPRIHREGSDRILFLHL